MFENRTSFAKQVSLFASKGNLLVNLQVQQNPEAYFMKQTFFIWINTLLLCFAFLTAHATGDPKAGENKSLVCSACHGPQGISANPEWPHLAGQHAPYLTKQLHDFKEGKSRSAVTMSPMVANLSDQDMEDLAAYYAAKPRPATTDSQTDFKRGETIYRHGDTNKKITACIACHGPDGKGNAQAGFPMICNQQSNYTILQLHGFKSGERHNDLNSIMHDITGRMDDEDIKAIAEYLTSMGK